MIRKDHFVNSPIKCIFIKKYHFPIFSNEIFFIEYLQTDSEELKLFLKKTHHHPESILFVWLARLWATKSWCYISKAICAFFSVGFFIRNFGLNAIRFFEAFCIKKSATTTNIVRLQDHISPRAYSITITWTSSNFRFVVVVR